MDLSLIYESLRRHRRRCIIFLNEFSISVDINVVFIVIIIYSRPRAVGVST